jgi:hypothetical protein
MSPIYTPGKLVLKKEFIPESYMYEFPSQYPIWTPANITTALWLDAADASTITQSSNLVSQWNDKSGNGRNATQASSTLRPLYSASRINGKPAIYSDGIDDLMVFGSAVCPNNFTIIAVGQVNSTDNIKSFVFNQFTTGVAGRTQASFVRGDSSAFFQLGAFISVSSAFTLNANQLCEWSRVAGTGTITVNATNTNTGALTDTIDSGNSSIFGRSFGAVYSQVTIGELVIVANGASIDNRQKLEGYLAHKWGLAANLPGGHPYKTVGPTP